LHSIANTFRIGVFSMLFEQRLNRGEYLMPNIKVKDNESQDMALRRFKRACEKDGLLSEMRRRERFIKPTEVRKRAKAAAIKRYIKKLLKEDPFFALKRRKKDKKD